METGSKPGLMPTNAAPPAVIWQDSSYDPRKTEVYDISVLLREDTFFYAITGLEKTRPLAMGRISGHALPSTDGSAKTETLQLPKGVFRRLFIYHYSEKFSLFPAQFQDVFPETLTGDKNHFLPLDVYANECQVNADIFCRYPDFPHAGDAFHSLSREVSDRHFAMCAIAMASRLSRDKGTEVLLATYGHRILTTIVYGEDDLMLASAFITRTAEDAVYYLLNVYRHFMLQYPDLMVILGGDLSLSQRAGIMASPYLARKEDFYWACPQQIPMELLGEESVFLSAICVL